MYKLIASDVDGTLIKDSTPDLYPEIIETIKELKQKGILFCQRKTVPQPEEYLPGGGGRNCLYCRKRSPYPLRA